MSKYPPLVSQNLNPFQPLENLWEQSAEDMLIYTYVPEAGELSHEDALKLAIERDKKAAEELLNECIAMSWKEREQQILKKLGY